LIETNALHQTANCRAR